MLIRHWAKGVASPIVGAVDHNPADGVILLNEKMRKSKLVGIVKSYIKLYNNLKVIYSYIRSQKLYKLI